MAGQYSGCEEEEWEMMGLCGLHRSEYSLPQGPFSHASNRPIDGCHCRPSSDELPGHLSRIPSDTFSSE